MHNAWLIPPYAPAGISLNRQLAHAELAAAQLESQQRRPPSPAAGAAAAAATAAALAGGAAAAAGGAGGAAQRFGPGGGAGASGPPTMSGLVGAVQSGIAGTGARLLVHCR